MAQAKALFPLEQLIGITKTRITEQVPALSAAAQRAILDVYGTGSGFFYLPIAQALEWEVGDQEWLSEFAVTATLGHIHFAIQDEIIDRRRISTPSLALLSDACLVVAFRGLVDCGTRLGLDPLWVYRSYLEDYDTYCAATLRDARHRKSLAPYTADEVFSLGDKAAPVTTLFRMTAMGSGRASILELLAAAIRFLCTGLQLHDDLGDLAIDLEDGHVSFPASIAARALGLSENTDVGLIDSQVAEFALVASGAAEVVHSLALRAFDRAASLAAAAGSKVIEGLAIQGRDGTQARLRSLSERRGAWLKSRG